MRKKEKIKLLNKVIEIIKDDITNTDFMLCFFSIDDDDDITDLMPDFKDYLESFLKNNNIGLFEHLFDEKFKNYSDAVIIKTNEYRIKFLEDFKKTL